MLAFLWTEVLSFPAISHLSPHFGLFMCCCNIMSISEIIISNSHAQNSKDHEKAPAGDSVTVPPKSPTGASFMIHPNVYSDGLRRTRVTRNRTDCAEPCCLAPTLNAVRGLTPSLLWCSRTRCSPPSTPDAPSSPSRRRNLSATLHGYVRDSSTRP